MTWKNKFFAWKCEEPKHGDIIDADKKNAKRDCNKKLRYCLYVQSSKLLLVDVFESFQNVCDLDPTHFLFATGLAWSAALKMSKVKLELLNDILLCY